MATSTSSKVNSFMATSASIKGRRQVSWKKVQTLEGLIFFHVDKSSIRGAEVKQPCWTVQNAEINFRTHFFNVADDASPVENRSSDQNHILIGVFDRGRHDNAPSDKLTFGVLDWYTTHKYICPHLSRSEETGECAATQECVIGLIIIVSGRAVNALWLICSLRRSHRSNIAKESLKCSSDGTMLKTVICTLST